MKYTTNCLNIFRLVIGSLCGAVIMFESALRRTIVQDKFELTFVASSQVLVKELQETNGENVLIESQLGLEIYDVRIMGTGFFLFISKDCLFVKTFVFCFRKK